MTNAKTKQIKSFLKHTQRAILNLEKSATRLLHHGYAPWICIIDTSIMDTSIMIHDTCIIETCIIDSCIIDICIRDSCIRAVEVENEVLVNFAWVTRARRTKSGGLKGLHLEVGAQRAPRFLVRCNNCVPL